MQRRFLAWMTVAAAVCAAAQGLSGVQELALYATPFFLIVALLASGRFLGEARILRRRLGPEPRPMLGRTRSRWPAVPQFTLPAFLERSPASRRGPPAAVAAVLA